MTTLGRRLKFLLYFILSHIFERSLGQIVALNFRLKFTERFFFTFIIVKCRLTKTNKQTNKQKTAKTVLGLIDGVTGNLFVRLYQLFNSL